MMKRHCRQVLLCLSPACVCNLARLLLLRLQHDALTGSTCMIIHPCKVWPIQVWASSGHIDPVGPIAFMGSTKHQRCPWNAGSSKDSSNRRSKQWHRPFFCPFCRMTIGCSKRIRARCLRSSTATLESCWEISAYFGKRFSTMPVCINALVHICSLAGEHCCRTSHSWTRPKAQVACSLGL